MRLANEHGMDAAPFTESGNTAAAERRRDIPTIEFNSFSMGCLPTSLGVCCDLRHKGGSYDASSSRCWAE